MDFLSDYQHQGVHRLSRFDAISIKCIKRMPCCGLLGANIAVSFPFPRSRHQQQQQQHTADAGCYVARPMPGDELETWSLNVRVLCGGHWLHLQ
eukprot:4094819-Amphidinium_carterae.1